jgi:hypothetical protein
MLKTRAHTHTHHLCTPQHECGYKLHRQLLPRGQDLLAVLDAMPDTALLVPPPGGAQAQQQQQQQQQQTQQLLLRPSPVLHLRLLLRLVLQQGGFCVRGGSGGGAGPQQQQQQLSQGVEPPTAAGADAGGAAPAPGDPQQQQQQQQQQQAAMAPTLAALQARVKECVAGAASLSATNRHGSRAYPVVVVQQAFSRVFGFEVPLNFLGAPTFKQLLQVGASLRVCSCVHSVFVACGGCCPNLTAAASTHTVRATAWQPHTQELGGECHLLARNVFLQSGEPRLPGHKPIPDVFLLLPPQQGAWGWCPRRCDEGVLGGWVGAWRLLVRLPVLCCAALCCAVLCCAVLCCAVLCCAVLCCAVLCCAERS